MTVAPFIRDRFTWLAYFMLAFYSYMQTAALGPVVPYLREEMALSYRVTGLHATGFAAGMLLAGLVADQLAERWGRSVVFWGGGFGMALGSIALILVRHPAVTIPSAFVMGFIGTFTLVMVQATISDHHGSRRAIGLTESNIAASVFAAVPPLIIGLGEQTPVGWRLVMLVGASYWLLLFGIGRTYPIPLALDSPVEHRRKRAPLPRIYWAYWLVILMGVATEWCVVFWAADYLSTIIGFSTATSASLVSLYFVANIIGRTVGSRLSERIASRHLLLGALIVAAIGFPIFWLAPVRWLNVVGLFVAGLGLANLFPLGLAAASNAAPQQANAASARVSLAAGVAILTMPLLLGDLADRVGIRTAFYLIPALLAVTFLITALANRLRGSAPVTPTVSEQPR